MKAITFFEEDREPTPDNPNKIITGIVDDNAEIYIKRLEQENKQLNSILTELEEWLKEEKENYKYSDHYRSLVSNIWLNKLNELKEKYK